MKDIENIANGHLFKIKFILKDTQERKETQLSKLPEKKNFLLKITLQLCRACH